MTLQLYCSGSSALHSWNSSLKQPYTTELCEGFFTSCFQAPINLAIDVWKYWCCLKMGFFFHGGATFKNIFLTSYCQLQSFNCSTDGSGITRNAILRAKRYDNVCSRTVNAILYMNFLFHHRSSTCSSILWSRLVLFVPGVA